MALSFSPAFQLRSGRPRQPLPLAATLPAPMSAPVLPHTLRLIAGFCATRGQALHLHAQLSGHLRLQPAQALLLSPAEAESPRFAACLQRWRQLRQAHTAPAPASTALPAWIGRWTGLVCQLAGRASACATPPLSRFDRTVQKQLAQGLHAVVVQEPRGQYSCNYVLASLRDAGVPWCAEAPRR